MLEGGALEEASADILSSVVDKSEMEAFDMINMIPQGHRVCFMELCVGGSRTSHANDYQSKR